MDYRPMLQPRRELYQRHGVWPPNNRKTIVHNRNQANNPSQFFSKRLICRRKPHIKLFCPHCHTRCLTFMDYKKHLHTDKHIRAIGKRIAVIEREIGNKRDKQAEAQATADKAAKVQGTSSTVVKYCAVCDLNFYQEEGKHIASKLHLDLQKLLEPRCNICCYQAKDVVDYENHLCSLDHLKREECWTGEIREYNYQPFEDVPKSNESKTVEASTFSKDDMCEPSTSGEAMMTQLSTEASSEHSKNSIDPSDHQEDIFIKVALYCACCNLYFNCEEGQQAAKIKHCKTQQHLELWLKYVEENSKPQDGLKE